MIHPSYVDLMQVVNKGVEEGETPVINSRYSIIMATANRARQIVDGDDPLIHITQGEKPLSIAVEELNQEKIHILAENAIEEESEGDDLAELTGKEYETEDADETAAEEMIEEDTASDVIEEDAGEEVSEVEMSEE